MPQQQELANAMTTKYSSALELWAQQEKAVTEGLCMEDAEAGVENKSEDFFGVTTMRLKDTRDTDLTKSQVNTRRRWVFSDPYYNQVAVDTSDKLRMRVDPATGIAQAQLAAAMRTKDKIMITAATAIAYGGKTFANQIAFPVAGTLAEANTGFVLAKYDGLVEYLKRYGQMGPNDRIWVLWTSAEEATFMNVLQVSSRDYTTSGNRDKGQITSYGLVDFHRIEDLYDEDGVLVERMMPYSTGTGTGGANVRTVLAGVKKAIRRWTPKAPSGDVWWNGSKRQWEITTEMDCGAARRFDRGVVAVPCITSAP
jgi:hypothetical protein